MLILNILFSAPQTTFEWFLLTVACIFAVVILGAAVFLTIRLIKEGKLGQIKDAIVAAIKEAEKTHGSGEDKLAFALEIVKNYCVGIGVKVDDRLIAWIVEYIRKYILDHNELEEIEEQEGKR